MATRIYLESAELLKTTSASEVQMGVGARHQESQQDQPRAVEARMRRHSYQMATTLGNWMKRQQRPRAMRPRPLKRNMVQIQRWRLRRAQQTLPNQMMEQPKPFKLGVENQDDSQDEWQGGRGKQQQNK